VIPYAREIEDEDHEVPESEGSFRVKVPWPCELELADASAEVGQQSGGQEEGNGVELVQQIVELTSESQAAGRRPCSMSTHRCDDVSSLSMAECMHITSM